MDGMILNIQRFCVNDGDGIRTTVFLKGCPLNCAWCHNPESKSIRRQIFFLRDRCLLCGKCISVCKNNCHIFYHGQHLFEREKCTSCGECVHSCINEALETSGEIRTVDEIMNEVLKDRIFYETSGGGLTLSGGEPMLQYEFTYELLLEAKKEKINTAIETSGFAQTEKFGKILNLVDTFLYDYKITNEQEHIRYTDVSNKIILDNLYFLNRNCAKIVLRCPIIPTINDDEAHLKAIGELAQKLDSVKEVHVEPYHPLGKGKAAQLGVDDPYDNLTSPNDESVSGWIEKIQEYTEKTVRKS